MLSGEINTGKVLIELRSLPVLFYMDETIIYLYLPGVLNLCIMQLDCGNHRISMMFSKTHLGLLQIEGAVNQRDMRKGLRVVSQGDIMLRFDFFRKQAQPTSIT